MRTRTLGGTGAEVTAPAFGGGPLGGLFAPLDDATAAQALDAAWDGGIRSFDRSPHYGMRSADEVRDNLTACGARIPAQVWADLRTEGRVDERAPTATAG